MLAASPDICKQVTGPSEKSSLLMKPVVLNTLNGNETVRIIYDV